MMLDDLRVQRHRLCCLSNRRLHSAELLSDPIGRQCCCERIGVFRPDALTEQQAGPAISVEDFAIVEYDATAILEQAQLPLEQAR